MRTVVGAEGPSGQGPPFSSFPAQALWPLLGKLCYWWVSCPIPLPLCYSHVPGKEEKNFWCLREEFLLEESTSCHHVHMHVHIFKHMYKFAHVHKVGGDLEFEEREE